MFRVLHDSVKCWVFSGSKLLTPSRSIFGGTTQRPFVTSIGNATSRWGGHTTFGVNDSKVALKGSSNLEMRSMGYNSLDTD